jgi:hypothetical protein
MLRQVARWLLPGAVHGWGRARLHHYRQRQYQRLPAVSEADFGRLLTAGVVNAHQLELGLLQHLPVIGPAEAAGFVRAARMHPALALHAARSLAGMPALLALYHSHPSRPSRRALRLWSRAVARVCGDRPDVP